MRGKPDCFVLIVGGFVSRKSDQREDGSRRGAFHPDKLNRQKYMSTV